MASAVGGTEVGSSVVFTAPSIPAIALAIRRRSASLSRSNSCCSFSSWNKNNFPFKNKGSKIKYSHVKAFLGSLTTRLFLLIFKTHNNSNHADCSIDHNLMNNYLCLQPIVLIYSILIFGGGYAEPPRQLLSTEISSWNRRMWGWEIVYFHCRSSRLRSLPWKVT